MVPELKKNLSDAKILILFLFNFKTKYYVEFKMNESGMKEKEILSILREARKKDTLFSSGRVLSSMCTKPSGIAKKAYGLFIESNLGDKSISSGSSEIESECIKMISSLLNLKSSYGNLTSGGTEANILAMLAAGKRKKGSNIVIPESAHFSFDKISNMGIEILKASLDENFCVDLNSVKKLINKETLAVVGVAGTTEYGRIDDIKGLSEICGQENLWLHVDAAFGGFVIPFMKELGYNTEEFDFSIKNVSSITIDPHKMGLSVIPSGAIIFREKPEISIKIPYLSTEQFMLTGTRPGASAAATWAALKFHGKEGYRKTVRKCMENTYYLYENLKKMKFRVFEPTLNIVNFEIEKQKIESVRKKGWKISETRKKHARIVIMPHTKKAHLKKFLEDLKTA